MLRTLEYEFAQLAFSICISNAKILQALLGMLDCASQAL
jgi:hypothetical protein